MRLVDDRRCRIAFAVSIHAPVKGATQEAKDIEESVEVSIHAPVKGATFGAIFAYSHGNVSIHAPVKGATLQGIDEMVQELSFNPRTREGCDLDTVRSCGYVWFQSTHP